MAAGDAIADAAPHIAWAGYLSTTGVYGDHGGGWVDEDTPLTASTRRGEMRVEAEAAWRALAERSGLPLHIFRLAGIYGPGRGPFEKVRDGTARRIIKPGQVFSRTHVEDIAQVLHASILRPNPGAAYNVCDDDPAPPEDVLAHAAELLGLPPPPEVPYETAEMTPMARSFYAESKRVRNRKIKEELGVVLRYPDLPGGPRSASGGRSGRLMARARRAPEGDARAPCQRKDRSWRGHVPDRCDRCDPPGRGW
jgi:nucleoside-diphosphate-sugar epimerase